MAQGSLVCAWTGQVIPSALTIHSSLTPVLMSNSHVPGLKRLSD